VEDLLSTVGLQVDTALAMMDVLVEHAARPPAAAGHRSAH
jgi:hypothetical protein